MESLYKVHRFTWRTVALALVGAVAGAALVAPTTSAAAALLTKKKATKLYLGNTTIVSETQTIQDNHGRQFTLLCPTGYQATNGGANSPAQVNDSATDTEAAEIVESAPISAGGTSVGWQVEVIVSSAAGSIDVTAYAVCAK